MRHPEPPIPWAARLAGTPTRTFWHGGTLAVVYCDEEDPPPWELPDPEPIPARGHLRLVHSRR